MSNTSRFHQRIGVTAALLAIAFIAVFAEVKPPLRLDLYDASGNNLMFVTFEYDGTTGRNTGRTVYMSDSTFVREVKINYDSEGRRINEVSYNFNGDTSFVTSYEHNGGNTAFWIVDQFKLDHIGGKVSYSNTDPLNFDLKYQANSATAAKMIYSNDQEGNLTRVDIADQSGMVQYYGVFLNTLGVKRSLSASKVAQQTLVKMRGASIIDVNFNLRKAADVRCDLITLSGRLAGTLFSGQLKQGMQKKSLRLDGGAVRQANGVYLFVVSVDGVTVSTSRILYRNQAAGGVR
jgi:hypothetical protein